MGALNKLISFGNSKQGKFVSWIIVGFATFIFFMGILFATIGGGAPNINSIELDNPQMSFGTRPCPQAGPDLVGYHLDLTERETIISVTAHPIAPTVPVILSTNSQFISFASSRISPGGTAIIRMERYQGMYMFCAPDSRPIEITIVHGNLSTRLFVRLVLTSDNIRVTAQLEHNNRQFLNFWHLTTAVDMEHIDTRSSEYFGITGLRYRVRLTATIFGETMFDTGSDISHFFHFGFEEIPLFGSTFDIDLFNTASSMFYIFTTHRIDQSDHLQYRVWFQWNGQRYLTDSPLAFNLIGWRP